MYGRRIRTNFEPARRFTSVNITPIPKKAHAAPEQQQPLSRFCGPYEVNDSVRVRLPHVPKGCSHFSAPRRITEVLGNYAYRLTDGQVWNARRLIRAHQTPRFAISEREEDTEPPPLQQASIRRSTRTTRGLPPIRFPHGTL